MRRGGLGSIEHAEHVHVEHCAPVLRVGLGEGRVQAEPSVVDQEV
jgi:hypothetical protein